MARRAAYAGGKKQQQPVPPPPEKRAEPTTWDMEQTLTVDEAKSKLAAAKQEAADAVKRGEAKVVEATLAEDRAKAAAEKAAQRERAASLPARLARQKALDAERVQKITEITAGQRKQYNDQVDDWCTIIHQRLGYLNNSEGKEGPRIRLLARVTYSNAPRWWTAELRNRYAHQATLAQKLLDHIERQKAAYVLALQIAEQCKRTGPPRDEFQQRQEMRMQQQVGVCGNGWDVFRGRVNAKPHRDWVEDPEVVRMDWALTSAVDKILREGEAMDPSQVQPETLQTIGADRTDYREYVKSDLRRRAEIERAKSPVERQTRGIVDGAAYGLSEF